MPPFLPFLLKLAVSTAAFVMAFRLLADTADRLAGKSAAGAIVALAVRVLVVLCWAGWVAALVTATVRRPDVQYDWFYYLVTGSLFLGPFGVMGRKADARGATRVALVAGASLLALCLLPELNERLFGWMPWWGGR